MKYHPSISSYGSKSLLLPDYTAKNILDVDFLYLKSKGIKACLIDLDDTIVARDSMVVDDLTAEYIKKIPMRVYIASNRPKSNDLLPLAKQIGASGVVQPDGLAGKPSRRYFEQALRAAGCSSGEIVMIGDHIFQDVFGANRVGINTVAVSKFGKVRFKYKLAALADNVILSLISKKYIDIEKG